MIVSKINEPKNGSVGWRPRPGNFIQKGAKTCPNYDVAHRKPQTENETLTEVFLLPRIQVCSLHRLNWLLLPYDYRHDYFLVSGMLKLSFVNCDKTAYRCKYPVSIFTRLAAI